MRLRIAALIVVVLSVATFAQAPAGSAGPQSGDAAQGGRGARRGGGGGGGGGQARDLKIAPGPDLGYVGVEHTLPLPEGMTYASVADVAVNSKGHVFVFHRAPVPLLEFDAADKFVRGFGEGLSSRPHGLRIDASDNLWMTDVDNHVVIKMDPQGRVLMTLGVKGKNGPWDEAAGSRLLDQPTDVAFAANGDFFVSQGHGGVPKVLKFDKNGKLLTMWSPPPGNPDIRTNLHTIVLDKAGLLYAGDRETRRILVFDGKGALVRNLAMPSFISGLYITKEQQLLIATGYEGQILRTDLNGKILGVTGKPGKGNNEYGEAHHLTMGPGNVIWVADTSNSRVQKLVPR